MLNQNYPVDELIIIDDGSSDKSLEVIKNYNARIIDLRQNKGRGYVRNLAIKECKNELILCCDATNSLDRNFLQIAVHHIKKSIKICSVSGIIKAKIKKGVVCRWRSRHLFKEEISYPHNILTSTSLVTYGTLVRKSCIMHAGNFNLNCCHSEDEELGKRLLSLGYKSIGDPKLITYSEITNSLAQVLERHWRWHIGKDEHISLESFLSLLKASVNPMMVQDFKSCDFPASLISMCYPFFFLYKTFHNNYRRKSP